MKSTAYKIWRFLLAWLVRVIFLVIPKNRENEPDLADGPYIVCSNHISAVDPVLICDTLKKQQPRFMAKKEVFSIPVIGKIVTWWGAYPVDRAGKDAGVILRTVKMLQEGYCIGLFPQGTRRPSADPRETPIRNGVGLICSRSRAQVLPVYISSSKNRVRWLHPVRVYVGKPIPYEEYTGNGTHADDYAYISRYVFDRVCSLPGEAADKNGGGKQ